MIRGYVNKLELINNFSPLIPPSNPKETSHPIYLDSCATHNIANHQLIERQQLPTKTHDIASPAISFKCADNETIISEGNTTLPYAIPAPHNQAYIIDNAPLSLVSLPQLIPPTSSNYAIINKDAATLYDKDNTVLLRAPRDPDTTLWFVPDPTIREHNKHTCMAITVTGMLMYLAYQQRLHLATDATVVEFVHKTMGCPPLSTFLNAVDRGYIKFPGPRKRMMLQNPPNSKHSTLGHMDQVRKHFQSTQLKHRPINRGPKPDLFFDKLGTNWDNDDFHLETKDITDTNSIYYQTRTMYGDATGTFPITSSEGHTHMMLFFH